MNTVYIIRKLCRNAHYLFINPEPHYTIQIRSTTPQSTYVMVECLCVLVVALGVEGGGGGGLVGEEKGGSKLMFMLSLFFSPSASGNLPQDMKYETYALRYLNKTELHTEQQTDKLVPVTRPFTPTRNCLDDLSARYTRGLVCTFPLPK